MGDLSYVCVCGRDCYSSSQEHSVLAVLLRLITQEVLSVATQGIADNQWRS